MQPFALPTMFSGLSPADLSPLLGQLRRRHFAAGESVIAAGATPVEMFVLQRGTASLSVADSHGLEQRIGLIGPGETAGESSLFTRQPSPFAVRALTDIDVLVLGEVELHRAAAAHPGLYRNVSAILSHRLAQASRHSASQPHGRLTVLQEQGAPPLLAYALACSVAWHTRRPTILLALIDGDVPAPLAALATASPSPLSAFAAPPGRASNDGGAHLMLLSAAVSGLDSLPATLGQLCEQYDNVLLTGLRGAPAPLRAARTVLLAGERPPPGSPGDARSGHTICAWSAAGRWARPGADGVLRVPPLRPADECALRRGLLPVGTPAGTALGWAARDLAGLKVGLAFGAGGARGFAHVGVLRVLERLGVTADYVAGTSIGAAVAALYAIGHDAEGVLETIHDVGTTAFRFEPRSTALLSNAALRERLQAVGGETLIEDMRIPLGVVAADLVSRQEVVFRSGRVWPAVLASMSIPGLFPAQCIGPYTLVDGAVLNPLPSDVVTEMGADRVIAVKLSAGPSRTTAQTRPSGAFRRPPSALEVMSRTISLMQSSAAEPDHASIVIAPDFGDAPGISLRRFGDGRRYVDLGCAAADAIVPQLVASLPWLRGIPEGTAPCL